MEIVYFFSLLNWNWKMGWIDFFLKLVCNLSCQKKWHQPYRSRTVFLFVTIGSSVLCVLVGLCVLVDLYVSVGESLVMTVLMWGCVVCMLYSRSGSFVFLGDDFDFIFFCLVNISRFVDIAHIYSGLTQHLLLGVQHKLLLFYL